VPSAVLLSAGSVRVHIVVMHAGRNRRRVSDTIRRTA
jgi:hypothetical protein